MVIPWFTFNFKMSKIPKYLYIFSISILFFIQKRNKNHELSINSESSEKKKIAFCYRRDSRKILSDTRSVLSDTRKSCLLLVPSSFLDKSIDMLVEQ